MLLAVGGFFAVDKGGWNTAGAKPGCSPLIAEEPKNTTCPEQGNLSEYHSQGWAWLFLPDKLYAL